MATLPSEDDADLRPSTITSSSVTVASGKAIAISAKRARKPLEVLVSHAVLDQEGRRGDLVDSGEQPDLIDAAHPVLRQRAIVEVHEGRIGV
jgi:hypothetical protein